MDVWFAYIGIGIVIGLFAGLLGVGGGWLLTPTLSIMGFPATHAVGTTLTQMVGTAALGVFRHRGKEKLHLKLAITMTLPMVAGVHLGRLGLELLDAAGIAITFILAAHLSLTTGLGIYMLRESGRRRNHPSAPLHQSLPRFGPTIRIESEDVCLYLPMVGGLVAGVLSGILGIGGGLVLVPVTIYVLGMDVISAVATNLFCMVFGSLNGAIGYGMNGQVDFLCAAYIVAGSFLGTWLGTHLAHNSDPRVVRRIFSMLLLVMASAITLRKFDCETFAQFSIFAGAFTLAIGAIVHAFRRRGVEDIST